MKTAQFNENYTLDQKAKGIRAMPKNPVGFPARLTADSEPFNPEEKYFFFDESTRNVRQTIGLRRVDDDWLGSFGLRIAKIEALRANKADALSDGQDFFRKRIENLRESIQDFEIEKSK